MEQRRELDGPCKALQIAWDLLYIRPSAADSFAHVRALSTHSLRPAEHMAPQTCITRHFGATFLFGLACAGRLISYCWLTKIAPQVLLVSHSWGDSVVRAFMRWAAAGDADWVERHVAAYVNIAGPTLGVPKAVTALLSGARAPRVQEGLLETRWAGSARWCTHRAIQVAKKIYAVNERAGLNYINSTAYRV